MQMDKKWQIEQENNLKNRKNRHNIISLLCRSTL